MYERVIKRAIDVILAALTLLCFSWLFLLLSLAILIDDPGPVLFAQKRFGRGKTFFQLHKFRSMKRSAPHDVPTHLFQDPAQYITRVGKFLRKSSLDELPQFWDILRGKMSLVGPRPALWNQEDLIEARDANGSNELRPGLTGWAQINGRDELSIADKSALDGVYAEAMRKGGWTAFRMDLKCFFGTFLPLASGRGVVEGGPESGGDAQKR